MRAGQLTAGGRTIRGEGLTSAKCQLPWDRGRGTGLHLLWGRWKGAPVPTTDYSPALAKADQAGGVNGVAKG